MKLYHFTAISNMKSIMSEGLTKGEMPTSLSQSVNAVNLTTDSTGVGHGLCNAMFLTQDMLSRIGIRPGATQRVPWLANKRKVRITLKLDSSRVTRWMRWATSNVESSTMTALIKSGGGKAKARTWYFADGPIYPAEFELVEVRHNGGWIDIRDYEGRWEDTFSDKALMDGYTNWGHRLLTGLPKELCARLEELIEHRDCVDQVKADALAEALRPETTRHPAPEASAVLMGKQSAQPDKQRFEHLDQPNCQPCLPPALNTVVGRTDVSDADAG